LKRAWYSPDVVLPLRACLALRDGRRGSSRPIGQHTRIEVCSKRASCRVKLLRQALISPGGYMHQERAKGKGQRACCAACCCSALAQLAPQASRCQWLTVHGPQAAIVPSCPNNQPTSSLGTSPDQVASRGGANSTRTH